MAAGSADVLHTNYLHGQCGGKVLVWGLGVRKSRLDGSCKGVDVTGLERWPTQSEIAAFAKFPQSVLGVKQQHKRGISEKLGGLVKVIHRFAPAFDVACQQQPFIATVVWGTCRFLLQAVVISLQLSERIGLALSQIIPCLSSLCRKTKLFEAQKPLLDAITKYLTQIIHFILDAREHFGRSKARRFFRAPFTNVFDTALELLGQCAGEVAEELGITVLEVQEQYRSESSALLRYLKETTKSMEGTLVKVEGMVTACGLSSAHRLDGLCTEQVRDWLGKAVLNGEAIPYAEPNTCMNLYRTPSWLDWEAAGYPNSFVVTGASGIGKSVYARAIATRSKERRGSVVLSHCFRASESKQSTEARTFAISILWQLFDSAAVTQRKEFRRILPKFAPFLNTYKNVRNCHLEGLLQLLTIILDLLKDFLQDFLLIVDALDECASDSGTLSKFLSDLGERPHAQVIIFTRDECLLDGDFKVNSQIRLDRTLIEPDLKCFVAQKVHRNPYFYRLQKEIVEAVLTYSQYNFLLARLLIENLESARSIKQQRDKLSQMADQMPDQIAAEYQRMFDEVDAALSPTERKHRDSVFRLLIPAKTPLSAQLISEAIVLDDETEDIDEEAIAFEPAREIVNLCRPFVEISSSNSVVFIHQTAKDFLLKYHPSVLESDMFLARKCLSALRQSRYRDWHIPARLLREHILVGTTYATDERQPHESSALYDYATLHFQDHITELKDPPEDVVKKLGAFLLGIEFVSWSEHLLDLTKQTSLSNQIAIYNVLLDWTKQLSDSTKEKIPIKDYWEKAHNALSKTLSEQSHDKILQYLPLVRNGNYFNGGGQSAEDWQKAYDNKKKVVTGMTDLLGSDSPVVLRFMTSLLQEYFWQKRFIEVLPQLLAVAKAQRILGSVGETDLFTTLWLLGLAYHCLTRFDEALAVFTEAAEGVADRLGKSDRRYLLIGLYKGHTLEQMLRFDEASLLYEEIREKLTPIVGSANGFTLMSQTAIGAVQRKRGDYQHAKRNLLDGWGGRKKIFSINNNICLDAAVQLALLLRDNREGQTCLELLDDVSSSIVYKEDFERYDQSQHIRALVAFDNGDFEKPLLALLQLLHKATGSHRNENNRELMWVRCTVSDVMRYQGREDEALMQFSDIVEPIQNDNLADEPEPPARLRLAEKAVRLIRQACLTEATALLRDNGLQWVREADFFVLGEGGPVADTAIIAPICFPAVTPAKK